MDHRFLLFGNVRRSIDVTQYPTYIHVHIYVVLLSKSQKLIVELVYRKVQGSNKKTHRERRHRRKWRQRYRSSMASASSSASVSISAIATPPLAHPEYVNTKHTCREFIRMQRPCQQSVDNVGKTSRESCLHDRRSVQRASRKKEHITNVNYLV